MKAHLIVFKNLDEIEKEFKNIGVDSRGSKIMRAKGFTRCIKLFSVPFPAANILKQEMLSIGGDVAVSRDSLTGKAKTTDCLVMGNDSCIQLLAAKLKKQPWGLSGIGDLLKDAVRRFEKKRFVLDCGSKRIVLGRRTAIMGVVNITPDSFSGDGILGLSPARGLEIARTMVSDGADIIDVGGESSRPGSRSITAKEEINRVIPFLKKLKKNISVPVSIDTTKSEVARAALDEGATIINDISALRFDKKMSRLAARTGACVILMHMKGEPRTMQKNPEYNDCSGEVFDFLAHAIEKAKHSGIKEEKIIVDPGIGFGKKFIHNIELLKNLSVLKNLGRPVLVGLSRKAFLGDILKVDSGERIFGTAAALSLAISNGADMVRVHDVKQMKQVAKVCDCFRN